MCRFENKIKKKKMIIKIKVYPKSGRQEIIKMDNENYKVYLKEPAEDNKANMELIKVLKKHFLKNIKIIKGIKSRNKIIKIQN
jgi:uncharacterized protein (TIGR00251 family)